MEGEPMIDRPGPQEPIVITELDELLLTNDLGSLSTRPIHDLRALREQLGHARRERVLRLRQRRMGSGVACRRRMAEQFVANADAAYRACEAGGSPGAAHGCTMAREATSDTRDGNEPWMT